MHKLIEFLNANNIPYTTQLNKNGDTVVDFLSYEIIQDGNDFCIAATNTMNFMWLSFNELKDWFNEWLNK